MSGDGEAVAATFHALGDLEKEFANVELDALLRKEFALKSLFEKRQTLLNHIPDFWPTVFLNGPEEVQQFFSPNDLAILASIKSFSVERYQIKSQTEGEPRSLRFTFQFEENEIFEDQTLVKEFEYKPNDHGPGNLISKPVPIKWKGKKKDVTNGLLTAAVELHAAEEALKVKKGDQMVDIVEREGLWQYEKLREKLVQAEESTEEEPSFINWFGFRGAVAAKVPENDKQNGDEEEDDDVDDDDDEAMLDVEVFPAGEEVAIALAEDLWPNVMDYFMQSQSEPVPDFEDDDEEDDDVEDDEDLDDAPELVPAEDENPSPRKRQKTN